MPPKQKYTRESILQTSLNIAKRDGLSSVVARNVGKELGCTVSPIFSYFKNMEELQQAVQSEALMIFHSQTNHMDSSIPAFEKCIMNMIKFAKDEPRLFEIVFNTEPNLSLDQLIEKYNLNLETDLNLMSSTYELSYDEALTIYKSLWIEAFGLSKLISTGINMSDDDINTIINRIFTGEIMLIKAERAESTANKPISRSVVKVSVKSK